MQTGRKKHEDRPDQETAPCRYRLDACFKNLDKDGDAKQPRAAFRVQECSAG